MMVIFTNKIATIGAVGKLESMQPAGTNMVQSLQESEANL